MNAQRLVNAQRWITVITALIYWLLAAWLLYRGVKLDSVASVVAGGVVLWFQQQPVRE